MTTITERQLDLFFAWYRAILVHQGWSAEHAGTASDQLIASALCRQPWTWSIPMRAAWEAAGIAGKPRCKPLFDAVRTVVSDDPAHRDLLTSIDTIAA